MANGDDVQPSVPDDTIPQTLSTSLDPARRDPAVPVTQPDSTMSAAEKPTLTGNTYREMIKQKHFPRPSSKEEVDALPPGVQWVDPKNKVHTTPYVAEEPEDYWKVPDGATWRDPKGGMHVKPRYEGVGFTAETLHDMALDDDAKEQALRVVYGDKVKRGPGNRLYVDDDGTLRLPGAGGMSSRAGIAAAEIAPAIGMTAGGVAGSGLGPVGTFAGGVTGAMAGRQLNNTLLSLAGVHQPMGEQVSSMGWEGAGVAGGEVVGKGLSKIPGAIGAGVKAARTAGSKMSGVVTGLADILESAGITPEKMRGFTGTSIERALQTSDITARGGKVGPAVSMPGAPMVKKIQEFNAVFEGVDQFGEAAIDFHDQEAQKILANKEIGSTKYQPVRTATQRPSSLEAGEKVIEAARVDLAHDDARLESARRGALAAAHAPVEAAGGEQKVRTLYKQALAKLTQAVENSKNSANNLLNLGIKELRERVKVMLEMTKNGEDPSAPIRMIDAELRSYNAAQRIRLKNHFYDPADDAAVKGPLPDTTSASDAAKGFLDKVPEILEQKYPEEMRTVRRLGQPAQPAVPAQGGQPAQPAVPAAEPLKWSELRLLRSWLRYGIDYNDLTPGMKEGSIKYLEKAINSVLHNQQHPALKEAVKLLDIADAEYKRVIPFLGDEMVRTALKAMESGAGINPEATARIFFDPDRTAAMRKARDIMGPNLWKAVESSHINDLVSKSGLPGGGTDAGKLAKHLLEEQNNGLLDNAYSTPNKGLLKRIIGDVAKMEGTLPIEATPTDTLGSLLRKAEIAKAEMEVLAKNDPLASLAKEVSKIDKQYNQIATEAQKERRGDPLKFLTEPSALAIKSADRILGSADLIILAADRFGTDKAEFNALRQVYTARFFQRAANRVPAMRGELAGEHGAMPISSEEVQALMFPGVTLKQMHRLATDMEFLFSGSATDFGGSLAAASRVINPLAHLPLPRLGKVGTFITSFPGVSTAARLTLGKAFAVTMDAVSHPNFVHWLAGRLEGSTADRMAARAVVQERLRLGGWLGAAAGQEYMAPRAPQSPPQLPQQPVQSRATGGPVEAGQPYVVGEDGPEVVVPGQDGQVVPNSVTKVPVVRYDAEGNLVRTAGTGFDPDKRPPPYLKILPENETWPINPGVPTKAINPIEFPLPPGKPGEKLGYVPMPDVPSPPTQPPSPWPPHPLNPGQLAGDVVPLPINPQQEMDHRIQLDRALRSLTHEQFQQWLKRWPKAPILPGPGYTS